VVASIIGSKGEVPGKIKPVIRGEQQQQQHNNNINNARRLTGHVHSGPVWIIMKWQIQIKLKSKTNKNLNLYILQCEVLFSPKP
jgi:hypothetical protein